MTKKQKAVLDYIKKYIAEKGLPPTFQDIAVDLGIKTKSIVHYRVKALIKLGHLKMIKHTARSLEVVRKDDALEIKRLREALDDILETEKMMNGTIQAESDAYDKCLAIAAAIRKDQADE
tara:strand:+ start:394 stop:753 length:360 start_codon:yes stop_codon:yes gene_type:complete